MRRLIQFGLFLLVTSLLAACASAAVPLAERLALPEDRPAFLFFYTDN